MAYIAAADRSTRPGKNVIRADDTDSLMSPKSNPSSARICVICGSTGFRSPAPGTQPPKQIPPLPPVGPHPWHLRGTPVLLQPRRKSRTRRPSTRTSIPRPLNHLRLGNRPSSDGGVLVPCRNRKAPQSTGSFHNMSSEGQDEGLIRGIHSFTQIPLVPVGVHSPSARISVICGSNDLWIKRFSFRTVHDSRLTIHRSRFTQPAQPRLHWLRQSPGRLGGPHA